MNSLVHLLLREPAWDAMLVPELLLRGVEKSTIFLTGSYVLVSAGWEYFENLGDLKIIQDGVADTSVEDLRSYKNKIESYTTDLKSSYYTYEQYKSHLTNQVYSRRFGVNYCCCGTSAGKQSFFVKDFIIHWRC